MILDCLHQSNSSVKFSCFLGTFEYISGVQIKDCMKKTDFCHAPQVLEFYNTVSMDEIRNWRQHLFSANLCFLSLEYKLLIKDIKNLVLKMLTKSSAQTFKLQNIFHCIYSTVLLQCCWAGSWSDRSVLSGFCIVDIFKRAAVSNYQSCLATCQKSGL